MRRWSAGLAILVLVTAVLWLGTGPGQPSVDLSDRQVGPVFVRGEQVDRDDFAIDRLVGPQGAIGSARRGLIDACMAARGFNERPVSVEDAAVDVELSMRAEQGESTTPELDAIVSYADDYARALFGESGELVQIGNVAVVLSRTELGEMWTSIEEGSCSWEASQQLGVDPHRRDALWMAVQAMGQEADAAFLEATDVGMRVYWVGCSGRDLGGLVKELGEAAVQPWLVRHPCLDHPPLANAAELRSLHHLAVAAPNQAIVDAWTGIVDTEWSAIIS